MLVLVPVIGSLLAVLGPARMKRCEGARMFGPALHDSWRGIWVPAAIILITTGEIFRPDGVHPGPILAALFVTVWEMFGSAFRSSLAEPMPITPGADSGPE